MSGHSKWAGIKHHKAVVDKKKGIAFSKAAKNIISAVKQGGPDPAANLKLEYAIEKARAVNMPRENIERAIKRASGEAAGDVFEELVYEGYAPAGVAVYIEILTDNRHRTAPEMRKLFEKFGGILGESGSVQFMFAATAQFRITGAGLTEDRVMEMAMDGGGDNYVADGDAWVVTGPAGSFTGLRAALLKAKVKIESSGIIRAPTTLTRVADLETAQRVVRFLDELDDHDDVQNVFSTVDFPDEIAAQLNSG